MPARKWDTREFLRTLALTGNVRAACAQVKIERSSAYRARKNDPAFRRAWDECQETFHDLLEQEALRRAVQGVEEPVFGKRDILNEQGKRIGTETVIVGTVRRYSDRLLEVLLRGHIPNRYRHSKFDRPEAIDPADTEKAREWIGGKIEEASARLYLVKGGEDAAEQDAG